MDHWEVDTRPLGGSDKPLGGKMTIEGLLYHQRGVNIRTTESLKDHWEVDTRTFEYVIDHTGSGGRYQTTEGLLGRPLGDRCKDH